MSPSKAEQDFESLLEYLKRSRGFDFTGYKRPSLQRRIEKRMAMVNVQGYAEYVDFLEVHPQEFAALFNTILINVTGFFRDESSWSYLAEKVLPDLIEQRKGELRVWSAGCASGEEAYTLVMIFAELLGVEEFKERVKIYATDVDNDALNKGRHAVYSEHEVTDVPEKLRKKYFERADANYTFRKDLRRQVIFGRHDLISDAPISRVDLLVCRNTLMYLNAETQAKILARFHFALTDGGVLFLGRAETLLTHASTFSPIDLKRRISRKVPRSNLNLRDRLLLMAQNGPTDDGGNGIAQQVRFRDVALDAAPVAQLVVDGSGTVVVANERARAEFGLGPADIGRPLQDLRISYRPVELRSLIEQTSTERRPVMMRDVEWQPAAGDVRWLDLQVIPLFDAGAYVGVSITFTDVSASKRLQRALEEAKQELEGAYEELQSTNEELETTNEELQSTVEELETTNEELQSTNEELETMNEELQSTNEELSTINDELRTRSDQLNEVNTFLDTVMSSVRGAVIVVDADLHIQVWSKRAEDLWGMRADEVTGKHLLGLDIGFPVNELRQPIRTVLNDSKEYLELETGATNRRGKPISCRVTVTRMKANDGSARGAILLMEELDGAPPRLRLSEK